MEETFRHFSEDGYIGTGFVGWKEIYYGGIYRNTRTLPYQWNTSYKKQKPIAQFMASQWRGEKFDNNKKCWFGCELKYKYSAN